MTTGAGPSATGATADVGGLASLAASHLTMTLLIIGEFILLQAVAAGTTTVIYSLIPALDAGARPTFDEWRRIFQVVGPTVTVSGGAGIVLSSIIFHCQAQKERQRAEAIRAEAQAELEAAHAETEKARAETEKARAETEKARGETNTARAVADERSQTIIAMQAELERLNARLTRLEENGSRGNQAPTQ